MKIVVIGKNIVREDGIVFHEMTLQITEIIWHRL